MEQVTVVEHPLVTQNLTQVRAKSTGHLDFRRLLGEISLLMGYEVDRVSRPCDWSQGGFPHSSAPAAAMHSSALRWSLPT